MEIGGLGVHWRHAVAVRNGRVFCNSVEEVGEKASDILWLDAHGQAWGVWNYAQIFLERDVYEVR